MTAAQEVVRRVSDDRGGILVLAAMLLPFLLLLVALTVDIGNWWVHKRHLQLQADAAALAGGGRFNECFANPAGADAVITGEATKYAGSSGSTYNEQVGNANKGAITVLYQSKTYAVGAPAPTTPTLRLRATASRSTSRPPRPTCRCCSTFRGSTSCPRSTPTRAWS